ncbi:hypothetical protein BX616_004078 [Lobosporangium transversale]|uniref:Acyl-protein thioesterase 1 n=1 Tax=Lobosporangium transversale TaxID=64571 RepID=A0A1Y2GWV2_9FUNG|nr:Phospholipase/carboxylesterase [Lobosporangium transversale]KAF9898401.1 hypothetical protein BX616_004078 [Lobosporangium transversale]ORZ26294.1 Phospholipase/carboxylesterase [Lobosporangium transversale]|eukprot:XP_021884059.1 Phospholipase/carboxylesterase [Lobosporangium transversale]
MTLSPSKLTSVVLGPTAQHTATVIFLHGYGDTGAGWAPFGEQWSKQLPHVKFIFPTAPAIPITIQGGKLIPAWFDVIVATASGRKQDEAGLIRSQQSLMQLIRDEIAQTNIPADRIIVGGFSQGCVTAVLAALTFEHRLAGIVALSGYMPLHEKVMTMVKDANRNTPIFWGHGDSDKTVQYDIGEQSVAFLQMYNYKVEFHTYAGMGHSACTQEISDMVKFFLKIFEEVSPLMAKA